MKSIIRIIIISFFPIVISAQNIDIKTVYSEAMKEYELGNYKNASEKFQIIVNEDDFDNISSTKLYNGACIFSLGENHKLSLEILNYLASNRFYSNLNHITNDTDLDNIHSYPKWTELIEKVNKNKITLPERTRKKIKTELVKAREILFIDNGKLWGENIWSDNLLVLDYDNTIYKLQEFAGSTTNDSILFYKKIPENTLSFTNSAQKYEDKNYAVIMSNYIEDNSSTIIHELFHILQQKHKKLNGNPIIYLDNYDAREWLRLEYHALINTLSSINQVKDKSIIETYINDAFLYRKLRQTKYKEFLKNELEIETLEGLANYTGYVLSTYPNKYLRAIDEIKGRERAETYTRPFPYATGLAYGLIFDHLEINWKMGLDTVYDFLNIYETKYLKDKIITNKEYVLEANNRNDYISIHKEEQSRKIENEKNIEYYTNILITQPILKVTLIDKKYSMSFNMNGTIVLDEIGLVYSSIKGVDLSGNNFGNFSTISGKDELGVSGILEILGTDNFIFPLPTRIEGNKIYGNYYEIMLNDGWKVITVNDKGDLEIVKKKE